MFFFVFHFKLRHIFVHAFSKTFLYYLSHVVARKKKNKFHSFGYLTFSEYYEQRNLTSIELKFEDFDKQINRVLNQTQFKIGIDDLYFPFLLFTKAKNETPISAEKSPKERQRDRYVHAPIHEKREQTEGVLYSTYNRTTRTAQIRSRSREPDLSPSLQLIT